MIHEFLAFKLSKKKILRCEWECYEVSKRHIELIPRPQALKRKSKINTEKQRKIFDLGGHVAEGNSIGRLLSS